MSKFKGMLLSVVASALVTLIILAIAKMSHILLDFTVIWIIFCVVATALSTCWYASRVWAITRAGTAPYNDTLLGLIPNVRYETLESATNGGGTLFYNTVIALDGPCAGNVRVVQSMPRPLPNRFIYLSEDKLAHALAAE